MKRKTLVVSALVIVALAAGGVYFARHRSRGETAQRAVEALAQLAMPVPRGDIVRQIEASGAITGARQADLSFSASGKIKRILVEVGQYVEAGQVLAEMDSSQQELALLKAQTAYELAMISGTPNAQREAELDLQVARANLENTVIRAPFSGVVTAVNVEEGEHASANAVAISLLDNSVFYAEVSVDELDMSKVRLGQAALVKVDALGGAVLKGAVSQIGMIAQSSGGVTTVPVTIRIEDDRPDLRVGYSASVVIEVERAEDVLKVPVEAVVRQGNRSFVTVIRDGERIPVEVVTGITDGVEVEIVSGLEPTDQIVGFNFAMYNNMMGNSGARSGAPGLGVSTVRIGGFRR